MTMYVAHTVCTSESCPNIGAVGSGRTRVRKKWRREREAKLLIMEWYFNMYVGFDSKCAPKMEEKKLLPRVTCVKQQAKLHLTTSMKQYSR